MERMKGGTSEMGLNRKRKRAKIRHKTRREKTFNHSQKIHDEEHQGTNPSSLKPIDNDDDDNDVLANESAASAKRGKPSSFLDKMRAKLSGGHFRMINEKLYTCTGKEALDYFKEDPALFDVYHTGYQEQMSHWPEQPVNIIIKWLQNHSPSLVVADFGCGDARLAKSVKNKVFSFDLVSNDPSVIACDMSNTSLDSSSIDVAVFCLSLMGTNFSSYLQEAHRVLKPSGWLLIAEVKSRFDPNTGGADPNRFLKAVCELGFTAVSKDFSNKMFILLYLKKKMQDSKRKGIEWPELKPCLYKRR
ncbi:ribosomal RNA-processing protein 8 isoform X1 [Malania oleifera]|uniref:ribosomal RNA-processing protein 8 isoform X1 n=1 Tax=Malania oleifera TaxID=397392 RepID=UPI0025AE5878|nr:ribosomal RNA-processing protein 8 isoform X1 [Malania oleifera]